MISCLLGRLPWNKQFAEKGHSAKSATILEMKTNVASGDGLYSPSNCSVAILHVFHFSSDSLTEHFWTSSVPTRIQQVFAVR